MPIQPTDLAFRLSAPDAARGFDVDGSPSDSLGGHVATTPLEPGLHGLFDAISGEDNLDGRTDYRCIFVHNAHRTLPLMGARLSLARTTPGGAQVMLGLDPTGTTAADSTATQAVRTDSPTEQPPGVSFVPGELRLGNLPPQTVVGVWLRRRALGGGPVDADTIVLRLEGDTSE